MNAQATDSRYFDYVTTLNQYYRGRRIHCCHHKPDILCRIDGQQHGSFFITTGAAKASAEGFIDRVIKEREDVESKDHYNYDR